MEGEESDQDEIRGEKMESMPGIEASLSLVRAALDSLADSEVCMDEFFNSILLHPENGSIISIIAAQAHVSALLATLVCGKSRLSMDEELLLLRSEMLGE